MESIQIISRKVPVTKEKTLITYSEISSPRSLDEFDINIIDLSDKVLWRNHGDSRESSDYINDYKTISKMIENRSKAVVIIQLPQNENFYYDQSTTTGKFYKSAFLKDMVHSMKNILSYLIPRIKEMDILYENTKTKIEGEMIEADFYFNCKVCTVVTTSDKSDKSTTIFWSGIYLTTLRLTNDLEKLSYLRFIKLLNKNSDVPQWFNKIKKFDDNERIEEIEHLNLQINELQTRISDVDKVLEKNNKVKSIIYTTGEELVESVFLILQDMLGCDLSDFIDEKKEDFLFELEGKVYIGEIKGVKGNVKNQYISQFEVHLQGYLDDNPEVQECNCIPLLIINHQRDVEPEMREAVHEKQVKLAKHYGSLIVETPILLDIYEAYKSESITREQVKGMLGGSGVLEMPSV